MTGGLTSGPGGAVYRLAGLAAADVVDSRHTELVIGERSQATHDVVEGDYPTDLLLRTQRTEYDATGQSCLVS